MVGPFKKKLEKNNIKKIKKYLSPFREPGVQQVHHAAMARRLPEAGQGKGPSQCLQVRTEAHPRTHGHQNGPKVQV